MDSSPWMESPINFGDTKLLTLSLYWVLNPNGCHLIVQASKTGLFNSILLCTESGLAFNGYAAKIQALEAGYVIICYMRGGTFRI